MNNLSPEKTYLMSEICSRIIENRESYETTMEVRNYIKSAEELQGKLKVDDFFLFFEHLKNFDLPRHNHEWGYTLHQNLSQSGEWNEPYSKRGIRNLKESDEMLINVIGSYANSSLVEFFPILFKKPEVGEAVQNVIEVEIRDYFEKYKKEIYEEYSKRLNKEREMMGKVYV